MVFDARHMLSKPEVKYYDDKNTFESTFYHYNVIVLTVACCACLCMQNISYQILIYHNCTLI